MRRGRATPGSSQRPLHTRGLALEPRTPPRHARWMCITSSLKESRPSHRGSERVSVLSKLTQQGQVFKQKKPHLGRFFGYQSGAASLPQGAIPSHGPKPRPILPPRENMGLRAARTCSFRSRMCVSAITFQTGGYAGGRGVHPWVQIPTPVCGHSGTCRPAPSGWESCPRHAQAARGLNLSSNTPRCVIWAIGESSLCLSVPICEGEIINGD